MLIELEPDEVKKILIAVNEIPEYDSSWDDLYDKIFKQYNHGEEDEIRQRNKA